MSKLLTGLTLIKDGDKFDYPYLACIKQMALLCNEVIVNAGTIDDYNNISNLNLNNVIVKQYDWNINNKDHGTELSKQVNNLLKFVNSEWILYLQADEFMHEKDFEYIINNLKIINENISHIELLRTYFFKDLGHRLFSNEIYLSRIFRTGTHVIGGDGMYIESYRNSNVRLNNCLRFDKLIYHYARIGNEDNLVARRFQLDGFFHDEEAMKKNCKAFAYKDYENAYIINHDINDHPIEALNFFRDKL